MLEESLRAAKAAHHQLAAAERNRLLLAMERLLGDSQDQILAANQGDLMEAQQRGLDAPRIAGQA